MKGNHYGSFAAMFIKIASDARDKGEAAISSMPPAEAL